MALKQNVTHYKQKKQKKKNKKQNKKHKQKQINISR